MHDWLYTQASWTIVVALIGLFGLCWELGFRLSKRVSRRTVAFNGQSQAIETAILTLFCLLLGFTYSMAVDRYEARRDVVLEESNAIGTAFLRADVMPEQRKSEFKAALREYLGARLRYYQAPYEIEAVRLANDDADRKQMAVWTLVAKEAAAAPTPVNAMVMASINSMIDARGRQLMLFDNVVPPVVLIFLFLAGCVAMAVIGIVNATCGARQWLLSGIFSLVVAATLFLLLDLDRPRRGFIRLSSDGLDRLHQDFESR